MIPLVNASIKFYSQATLGTIFNRTRKRKIEKFIVKLIIHDKVTLLIGTNIFSICTIPIPIPVFFPVRPVFRPRFWDRVYRHIVLIRIRIPMQGFEAPLITKWGHISEPDSAIGNNMFSVSNRVNNACGYNRSKLIKVRVS